MKKDMYILGIETSCDETAASIVKNGTEIVSNVVASQINKPKTIWRRCSGNCF